MTFNQKKIFTFNHNTTRGHCLRIGKPSVSKTLRKNLSQYDIDTWIELSEDIVTRYADVLGFKVKLNKMWLDKRVETSYIYILTIY